MPMSNADCIERLEGMLEAQENIESYILEDEDRDPDDLREVERDIEAITRAIRALERTSRKKRRTEGKES